MLKCIQDSFKLTNKYIILATPLILFSLISGLYILVSTGGNMLSLIVALILYTLMLAAFLSGWSFMLKSCVTEEIYDDPNMLIKKFPEGVGENFLSAIGLIINIFLLSGVFLSLSYIIGIKTIGHIGFAPSALSSAFESSTSLKAFLMSLSQEQLLKLNLWNLLIFGMVTLEYFMIMFYLPALNFKSKNPFLAFGYGMKDLFSKKFLKNVALYLIIFISYSLLSICSTIAGINIIAHFIFTLINFYYLVFAAIMLFNYYYNNFVKIGANVDCKV